jgi:Flp pilus assembly protein TadG
MSGRDTGDTAVRPWRALRRLAASRRGSATLELAAIAVPFFALVFAIIETCWQLTTGAVLDRVAARAARFGITGQTRPVAAPDTIACRSAAIPWLVEDSTNGFLKTSRLTVTTRSFSSVSGMGGASVAGAGAGGQVVTYLLSYQQPFIASPLLGLFGSPNGITHRAYIVVKNEPFDNAVC